MKIRILPAPGSCSFNMSGKFYDVDHEYEVTVDDFLRIHNSKRIPYEVVADDSARPISKFSEDKTMYFLGAVDLSSGYGLAAYNQMHYLTAKHKVQIVHIGPESGFEAVHARLAPRDYPMYFHATVDRIPNIPETRKRFPAPMGGNFTFETTLVPRDWVREVLNEWDFVTVNSEFCKKTFLDSGVIKPVYLARLGIDLDEFTYVPDPRNSKFVIGHSGHLTHRKGTDTLIEAFQLAFPPSVTDVELRLYSSNAFVPYEHFMKWRDPRIVMQRGQIDRGEYTSIFGGMDLYVYPSHGEGFGLTTLEAMACGTPVAMTKWSGMVEHAHEGTLWIDYDMGYCEDFKNEKIYGLDCGDWANPKLDSVIETLRYAYSHRDDLKKLRPIARARAEEFDWNKTIDELYDALTKGFAS